MLHPYVVVICHRELLLPRKLMQFDSRKAVSCLMTWFFCTRGTSEELGPQHRWRKPVITLSSLRQAWGIQIIFRAWIRWIFFFL